MPRQESAAAETTLQRPEGMTAESERDALIAARGQDERAKYTMGVHFNNLVQFELYRDLGCVNPEAFVERELGGEPGIQSLREWAAVAVAFRIEHAEELTCHKLSHLIAYAARNHITDLSNPGDVPIEVIGQDGVPAVIPLRSCTTTALERALARQANAGGPLEDLEKEADQLEAKLKDLFGATSHVRVDVRRRGRSGVLLIDNLTSGESQALRGRLSVR